MPSSDAGSSSKWSQFLGHRNISKPKRSFSLDAQSINTAVNVDAGQEQDPIVHQQPGHQLRRKKGRIFSGGVFGALRKLSGNKSPSSSSDPEDAPNRPHIVPPLHDSSDPERSSIPPQQNDVRHNPKSKSSRAIGPAFKRATTTARRIDTGHALTPQEKLSEISELMRVKTAGAGITLQRLAELDGGSELDGRERQEVLAIAREAANIASKEYARVRRTRPKMPLARILERNAEVPLAEVQDYKEYLRCLQLQAEELRDGVWGLGAFREVSRGVENVRKGLDEMSDTAERGDSAADMVEIKWLVERKCMFWAAVDILTADDPRSEQAEVTDYQI